MQQPLPDFNCYKKTYFAFVFRKDPTLGKDKKTKAKRSSTQSRPRTKEADANNGRFGVQSTGTGSQPKMPVDSAHPKVQQQTGKVGPSVKPPPGGIKRNVQGGKVETLPTVTKKSDSTQPTSKAPIVFARKSPAQPSAIKVAPDEFNNNNKGSNNNKNSGNNSNNNLAKSIKNVNTKSEKNGTKWEIDSDDEILKTLKPGPLSKKLKQRLVATKTASETSFVRPNLDKSKNLAEEIVAPNLSNFFRVENVSALPRANDGAASTSGSSANLDEVGGNFRTKSNIPVPKFRESKSKRTVVPKPKNVAKKETPSAIRRHHYSPHTISGKMTARTLKNLEEPKGIHHCKECPAVFDKSASLKSHVSRYHNPNLKNKCPECPKLLSSKFAIKKHLLSHRPKSEWPFACPLCQQTFQSRTDLPKHFFTSVHKNDPRVPQKGSEAWFAIIDSSCLNPDFMSKQPTKKQKRKRKSN